jgi:hypothetical protein
VKVKVEVGVNGKQRELSIYVYINSPPLLFGCFDLNKPQHKTYSKTITHNLTLK